ncbi:Holliday junction resolvase RecU [Cellulosilyticum ruminicola]|uniref:Holliday junction resolvase RecU n=1 Tax=Cellulosilyticum ruminicola TaxID=425254 RepID=UPI0006D0ADAC|nr:Holliday junction resolvase RecU [Cellulosilyticum ruminicola]
MGYWNTRGLRGNELEEQINITNELFMEKGLAVVQKVPTPIKPIRIDQEKRVITLAYFEQKSTVDYIGVVQGISICFDAKETAKGFLPMSNIHAHQVNFMKAFHKQGGEAFLIVYFKKYGEYYFLPIEVLDTYYEASLNGGRKSIPYDAFEKKYLIPVEGGMYLNYLKSLDYYLSVRTQELK